MSSAVIIDLVTIIVMCVAVFYAARLNRALGRARDGRSELAQLITSLTDAHSRAEAAIKTMKTTAAEYESGLQKQIAISRGLVDELSMINESSNALANRMERLAPMARGSFEAAYRAGEDEEHERAKASLPAPPKDRNTLRAERSPAPAEPAKGRSWIESAAKKVSPATTAQPSPPADRIEARPAAASAPGGPVAVRGMTPPSAMASAKDAAGDSAPRSRAEQELFAAIETLRKGRS